MSSPAPSNDPSGAPEKSPSLLQMIGSVLAAFFGVQSSKNRERDFKHGRAGMFIAIGIVMTVLFVLTVWMAVKITLHNAGMN
jgi:hypothetical protein